MADKNNLLNLANDIFGLTIKSVTTKTKCQYCEEENPVMDGVTMPCLCDASQAGQRVLFEQRRYERLSKR